MGNNKIKSYEDFLEKFKEVTKVLSFENESDVVILNVRIKDFTPVALKNMATTIEKVVGHKCIIVPDTVTVVNGTKDQTIERLEKMIKAIREIPDDASTTEISW